MGLISNQWLNKGRGVRNRSFTPVPANVSCEWTHGPWAERNNLVVKLTAIKSDGELQIMYLSNNEAEAAVGKLVSAMSPAAREELLCQFLGGLSDAKLLRVLSRDLHRRKPVKNEG